MDFLSLLCLALGERTNSICSRKRNVEKKARPLRKLPTPLKLPQHIRPKQSEPGPSLMPIPSDYPVDIHLNALDIVGPTSKPRLGPDSNHITELQVPHELSVARGLAPANLGQRVRKHVLLAAIACVEKISVRHVVGPLPLHFVQMILAVGHLVTLDHLVGLGVQRKVKRVRSLHIVIGPNLAHLWNKGGQGARIKGGLVNVVTRLETPLEANVEPGIRLVVSSASTILATPALVMGDDGEFDFTTWVSDVGGYERLVGVDWKLIGLSRDRLEGGFEVALMFVERRRRLDESKRKGAQLFVENAKVSIRERLDKRGCSSSPKRRSLCWALLRGQPFVVRASYCSRRRSMYEASTRHSR